MARIAVGLTVTVSTLGNEKLDNSGHRSDPGGITDDVFISVNASNVPTRSAVRVAVERLLKVLEGNSAFKP